MWFGCIDCVDIEITFKLSYLLYIHHAQTSLLDDCAGGTQGVQLLMDKIRAKYKQLDSG